MERKSDLGIISGLIVIVFLLFIGTGCSPKKEIPDTDAQIESNAVKPETGKIEELTVEKYAELPVWGKEQKAFALLSGAAKAGDMDELKSLYSQASGLFSEVLATLQGLELSEDIKKLNDLQIEVCRMYITGLKKFKETEDPSDLEVLKQADEKMAEFVKELGKRADSL